MDNLFLVIFFAAFADACSGSNTNAPYSNESDVDFSEKYKDSQFLFKEENGVIKYVKYRGKEINPNDPKARLAVDRIKNEEYEDDSIVSNEEASPRCRKYSCAEAIIQMSKNSRNAFVMHQNKLVYIKKDGYEYNLTNPADKIRAIREYHSDKNDYELIEEGQLVFAKIDGVEFDITNSDTKAKYFEKKKEAETLKKGI
jgi:hypothetical protein